MHSRSFIFVACFSCFLISISSTQSQTLNWEKVSTDGPGELRLVALAYDSHREVVVAYGGQGIDDSGRNVFNEATWEWDGQTWTQMTADGPGLVYGTNMVYDPIRRQTLLFGGGIENRFRSAKAETWAWDGVSWELVSTNYPPARTFHAMAFDESREGVVLHGGILRDPPHFTVGETHFWDGSEWTELEVQSIPRSFHQICFDANLRQMIMLPGHSNPNNVQTSLFGLDGVDWNRINLQRPFQPARVEYASAYNSVRKSIMVYGGGKNFQQDGNFYDELWELAGDSWEQLAMQNSPGGLTENFMVFDESRNTLVLYGGKIGFDSQNQPIYSGDTWELSFAGSNVSNWEFHR